MQVVNLGMPCSIARSGMRDSHWDNQTSQFCKGQTQILITTDIMARNSHLMQKVSHKPLLFTQFRYQYGFCCQYELSDMSLHAALWSTCRDCVHEFITDCIVDMYSTLRHILS